MIEIQIKVKAKHTSMDGVIRHLDNEATFLDLGGIYRIAYREDTGAFMVLDISDVWVQFKREEKWTTQAIFHNEEPSSLYIVSDEGELRFDVEVLSIKRKKNGVVVEYLLLQDNEHNKHRYECEWIQEEATWQENH